LRELLNLINSAPINRQRGNHMDKNTLVAVLGSVSVGGLTAFGSICVYKGIDGTIVAAVAGSLGAIIGAAAVYIKTR
jgi:NADPH-dependent curcumin reductase CurA